MRCVQRVRVRLRSLLRGGRVEQELTEEFQYHLERTTDEYVAFGVSRSEARSQALRDMGALEQRKEECRDASGLTMAHGLRQDVIYALRGLRRNPGFSAVAILSLAVGIGATTTIFTFVNAVFLRPLPYPGSERIVVFHEHEQASADPLSVHPANFVEWRRRARSFEALVLVQAPPLNVMGSSGAEQVSRLTATEDIFRVFGVSPVLGRGFTAEDTRPGARQVVVLGHGFWKRWFGGDPGVLDRQLLVQDGTLTIVGVAPQGFTVGSTEADVYTPLTIDPANPAATGTRSFESYGRLAAGVHLDAARAEMDTITSTLGRELPSSKGMGAFVSHLQEYLGRSARPGLRLLMGVVLIVLAIACVNLAGLLMARGIARRGEFALRASLGASRGRLIRQVVAESLVVSLCGAITGLALAQAATGALTALSANALMGTIPGPVQLDLVSVGFTVAIAVATALAFGVLPAQDASQADPQAAIRQRTRSATSDRQHHRIRSTLVVIEVALAVVLLVGAGLLVRTSSNLSRVDLGFQPAGTVTAGLFLGVRPPETRVAVLEEILDRVEGLPGVISAGTIQFLPLRGMTCGTGFWHEADAQGRDPSRAQPTECALVSRGYFGAMGIPVVEGRSFARRDRTGTPRVVMVNQAFAHRYFPDGRVLGRRVFVQSGNQELAEVIGVVRNVHHQGPTVAPAPTVFLLHAQTPGYITNLVVRTSGDRSALATAIRRAVHDVDPTQAVSDVGSLERDVRKVLAPSRLRAVLVATVAVIAVALAVIGLYGLLAYIVNQRRHEIGIRLALGATRETIFARLFTQGARLVVGGLILGLGAGIWLRRILATFVFGITAGDPATYALASVAFLLIALGVIAIPAMRASRLEPVTALRDE
jgi:putative ABC transport system permease protein